MRRIGVLMNLAADDPEGQARIAAFLQGLQEAGWAVGRNVRIDIRWGTSRCRTHPKNAAELAALAPDVIFATAPVRQSRRCSRRHAPCRSCSRRVDRSGRRRFRRKPGAAGRQRHRVCRIRIQLEREMARTAQRGRARRDASGSSPRFRSHRSGSASWPQSKAWRRRSAWNEPIGRARRRRDRARRRGVRA